MRHIRRGGLLLSFVCLIVSIGLLLNFTAPNPTGRRYSSDVPVLSGSPNEIGASAERILSHDLGVEKNTVNFDGVIPDFLTEIQIVEAKNCAVLPCESRGQFDRLIALASATDRELWVYTRITTRIPDDMAQRVHATGGAIVPYFVEPGYIDQVDNAARVMSATSVSISAVFVVWEVRFRRTRGETFMINRRLVLIIAGVAVIVGVTLLVLNVNAIRVALSTAETIAAIAFYSLAAIWIFKRL